MAFGGKSNLYLCCNQQQQANCQAKIEALPDTVYLVAKQLVKKGENSVEQITDIRGT